MKKLFSGLFLFLLSGAALADSGWNTSGLPTPVASHTDLSVAYLAQVFGTVGNSLQGTTGQMLGMIFSKLNEGIMVVAGLWLTYTILTIILRSAMDGSFMGPNKNVFWIVIRIALAFAMLIPGPMTGYNIIQDIVMKVVVEGVSLADQTWSYGLNYIDNGGTLWRSPEASGSRYSPIVSSSDATTILNSAQSVYQAEVCMVASSVYNESNTQTSGGQGVANTGNQAVSYNIVETNDAFAFPGVGNNSSYETNIDKDNSAAKCGYVSWNNIVGVNSNSSSTSKTMAKAALSQIVYDLYPAAKRYVCANYSGASGTSVCSGVDTSDMTTENNNATFNALINYINAVYPIAQAQGNAAQTSAKNFISSAETEGWMMAGRYYWDLSRIQAHLKDVSDLGSYVIPTVQSNSISNSTVTNFVKSSSSGYTSYVSNAVNTQLKNYQQASGAGATGEAAPSIEKSAGNKILNILLGGILGDITSLFLLFSTAPVVGMGPNPIVFLHEVGMKCIALAGDIWIDLAVTLFGLSAATMICQGTLNLDTPLSSLSNWIKPPLMLLATALLGVGVLLGYYAPLYPFMLFTFGVIGWIISVIEAMVAGPLIAFGLTHPEGHDFLGEAKQGLVLLLGVFLRPVLMVIGLIAGMILSYVSLRILLYTYSGFLQDIFYSAAPIPGSSGSVLAGAAMATVNVEANGGLSPSSLIMNLFCFPLMLAVFAMLVYVVTNQCFSLIYVLPDYILRWIGGPQSNPAGVGAAEMARQVQGAMGQMASTAGDATNRGMQAKLDDNIHKERSGEGANGEGTTTTHQTT